MQLLMKSGLRDCSRDLERRLYLYHCVHQGWGIPGSVEPRKVNRQSNMGDLSVVVFRDWDMEDTLKKISGNLLRSKKSQDIFLDPTTSMLTLTFI